VTNSVARSLAIEVIGAKIAIGLLTLEHVEYHHQNGMGYSNVARLFPLRAARRRNCADKIGALGMGRYPSGLTKAAP